MALSLRVAPIHIDRITYNGVSYLQTEQDFAEIAGAGLNWIRLPIPYWAIETWPGEPFLAKTAWKYVLLAFKWARKYGLRVLLDLHTIPGSQNGRCSALSSDPGRP